MREAAADRGGAGARVVLSTAPDLDVARRLARTLVAERLVACCNVVPGLTSVYHWRGEVREEGEVLLVLKTTAEQLDALRARLVREHPYDVPELVALEPNWVEPRYLEWLVGSLGEEPSPEEA